MTRSYRPKDQDKHPEEKPLPIDLAFGLNYDPEPWQQMAPVCWAAAIGFAVTILAAFAILWVVYG